MTELSPTPSEEQPFVRTDIMSALFEAGADVHMQQFVMNALDSWQAANRAELQQVLPELLRVSNDMAEFMLTPPGAERDAKRLAAVETCKDALMTVSIVGRRGDADVSLSLSLLAAGYAFLGTLQHKQLDMEPLQLARINETQLIKYFQGESSRLHPEIDEELAAHFIRSINGEYDDEYGYRFGLAGMTGSEAEEFQVLHPLYGGMLNILEKEGLVATRIDTEELLEAIQERARQRHLRWITSLREE